MKIKSLKLINFRNYDNLQIDFSKKLNVIYGDNAQGKTNILEAIFECSSGRSHRTSKDLELIKFGGNSYFIDLQLENQQDEKNIQISYDSQNLKRVKINDIKIKKIGDLMGVFIAVMFSPEDLEFIKDGPAIRRKFMDIAISQLKPSYFFHLQEYNKALKQRNRLLKIINENKSLLGTLDVWTENLVKIGSKIIKIRNDFISKISRILIDTHYKLTEQSEKLEMVYKNSFETEDMNSLESIEYGFQKYMKENLNNEIYRGNTLYGPHKDDYKIFLNNEDIKIYGSQGQQRTSVLSLKLSQIELIKQDTGEYPVILLDDVNSELDNKRQEYLFNNLENIQTFITCTSKDFFQNRFCHNVKYINIVNGNVKLKS